jgi:hypothetical protein
VRRGSWLFGRLSWRPRYCDGRNSVRPGEGTAIGINASASADRRECLEIRLAPSNETSLPDLSLVWALLARVHKEELQICQA